MNRRLKKGAIVGAMSLVAALSGVGTQLVFAQCGSSVSSCKSCHEIQKQMPISNVGQYHIDHAQLDACDYCHGGQPFATDKARAHQGMVDPFSDLQFNCGSCHPTDWQQRAASYGAQ